MKPVRIIVRRICIHQDLIDLYENPIEHACGMKEGMVFVSRDAQKPEGMGDSAWRVMQPYVMTLACGGGDFFDGWMNRLCDFQYKT